MITSDRYPEADNYVARLFIARWDCVEWFAVGWHGEYQGDECCLVGEAHEWCRENLQGWWDLDSRGGELLFTSEKDAVLFKLRWG